MIKQYRPCVGICLINQDGDIFVGERLDRPGAWQMPQGGTDGDDPKVAVIRELIEEIGTNKAEIIGQYPEPLTYDLPEEIAERLWDGQYAGQTQHWFYLRFTGHDSDIDITADETPEFSQWRWMKPDQIMNYIVPFKREIYETVLKRFQILSDNS